VGLAIIFEGVDCTGKSTFIQKLEAAYIDQGYNINIIHNGVYGSMLEACNAYMKQFKEAAKFNGITLFDRSFISEMVYGKVHRGTEIPEVMQNTLALALNNIDDLLVVWCNVPFEEVVAKWESRKDEEYIECKSKLKAIYREYEQFFGGANAKYLEFFAPMNLRTFNYLEDNDA